MTDSALDKLNKFRSCILEDATLESRELLRKVKEKHDMVMSSAEDDMLESAYRRIKSEVSRIKAETGQSVSRKMMDCNRARLARREEIAAEVIKEVVSRVKSFVSSDAYPEHLRKLAKAGSARISELTDPRIIDPDKSCLLRTLVLFLRPADMEYAEELLKLFPAGTVAEADKQIIYGGMIITCPQKHKLIDLTMDASISELHKNFFEMMNQGD